MKKSIDEHAARFDAAAKEYDEGSSEPHRSCVAAVVDGAAPEADDVVLDLGTGTGALALRLAETARYVYGRDISAGMLEQARRKATEHGIDNVEFDEGRFREPNLEDGTDIDIVVSNFAMHHLADEEKREAIEVIAGLGVDRIVLGDIMLFEQIDEKAPFFDPSVDDPATVGTLVEAFTDVGFAVTKVHRVHDQAGVIVADRLERFDVDRE
ncbi:MAG: methyltransferase domain-containing protein [Halobacteriales archaeon]|nr:methyltransferase domain-containing protein [Halobacteriales archaeon]